MTNGAARTGTLRGRRRSLPLGLSMLALAAVALLALNAVSGAQAEAATDPAPLTGAFSDAPESHDGSTEFTVKLRFSEDVSGLSYVTLRDHAFDTVGGDVRKASRVTRGSNQDWTITIAPSGVADVTITLPETTDCNATGAVCNEEGVALSVGDSATIAGPDQDPLTGAFSDAPESHDGSTEFTVKLRFSEDVSGLSYATLRDHAFDTVGGDVRKASRGTPGSNQDWTITIVPSGDGDVTITLPETTNCNATGAVCNEEGVAFSEEISATISGPDTVAADQEAPLGNVGRSASTSGDKDAGKATPGGSNQARDHETPLPWNGHDVVDLDSANPNEGKFDSSPRGQEMWYKLPSSLADVAHSFKINRSLLEGHITLDMQIYNSAGLAVRQNGEDIVNDRSLGNILHFIPYDTGTYYLRVKPRFGYTRGDADDFYLQYRYVTASRGDTSELDDCGTSYFGDDTCRISPTDTTVNGHLRSGAHHNFGTDEAQDQDVWETWLRPGVRHRFCVSASNSGGLMLLSSFGGTLSASRDSGNAQICGQMEALDYTTHFYFYVLSFDPSGDAEETRFIYTLQRDEI